MSDLTFDIAMECGECGAGLDAKTITRNGYQVIIVDQCETCGENEHEKGRTAGYVECEKDNDL